MTGIPPGTHLAVIAAAWRPIALLALLGASTAAIVLALHPARYRVDAVLLIPSDAAATRLDLAAAWSTIPADVLPPGPLVEVTRKAALVRLSVLDRDPTRAHHALTRLVAWVLTDAAPPVTIDPRERALMRLADLEPPRVLRPPSRPSLVPKPWPLTLTAGAISGALLGWLHAALRLALVRAA